MGPAGARQGKKVNGLGKKRGRRIAVTVRERTFMRIVRLMAGGGNSIGLGKKTVTAVEKLNMEKEKQLLMASRSTTKKPPQKKRGYIWSLGVRGWGARSPRNRKKQVKNAGRTDLLPGNLVQRSENGRKDSSTNGLRGYPQGRKRGGEGGWWA